LPPFPDFPRQRLVVRNCCAPLSFSFSIFIFPAAAAAAAAFSLPLFGRAVAFRFHCGRLGAFPGVGGFSCFAGGIANAVGGIEISAHLPTASRWDRQISWRK